VVLEEGSVVGEAEAAMDLEVSQEEPGAQLGPPHLQLGSEVEVEEQENGGRFPLIPGLEVTGDYMGEMGKQPIPLVFTVVAEVEAAELEGRFSSTRMVL
jgi:hypothetical protein